jgi:phosphomannomutase
MSESGQLMLSVSGLRGIIGDTLTPPVAARYGAAIGEWAKRRSNRPNPHVVVGRDSRASGPMVERATVAGLTATGCRVTTVGIVTTPGGAIMAEQLKAHAGVVITASHNPAVWNGIKALRHDGVAPPAEEAQQIIDDFRADQVEYVPVDQLQPIQHDETAHTVHVRRILPHLDAEAIRNRAPKVVLDSVCGAGGPATATLLEDLGAELVHLNPKPNGRFPHPPEPTAENLTELCDAVREHGADVGFAQDPDADRLAIVDENGRYIGEEYTLALGVVHLLSREPGPVVANLSTSRMIDDVAARFGCAVHRSPVGEANVAEVMRQVGAVAGGEGNGGLIWSKVIRVRDSLAAIAVVLELLAQSGKRLSELVAEIPAYTIVKEKLPIEPGMAERAFERLRERFADQQLNDADGLRIDWPDRWVHIRPSNTEPILRIIAEAADRETANELITSVRETI